MGLLEIIVLLLFIFGGFAATIGRNLYLHKQDERQESAIADLMIEVHGQNVNILTKKLGSAYEVDTVAPRRSFHVWKFPPSEALPRGRGLIVLTATVQDDVIIDIAWRRRRH